MSGYGFKKIEGDDYGTLSLPPDLQPGTYRVEYRYCHNGEELSFIRIARWDRFKKFLWHLYCRFGLRYYYEFQFRWGRGEWAEDRATRKECP